MSLYRHVLRCNAHNLDLFLPFIISGKHLGWIRNTFADHLRRWPRFFELSGDKVLINDNYPYALIKVKNEKFDFDKTFNCGSAKVKIKKPDWLQIT